MDLKLQRSSHRSQLVSTSNRKPSSEVMKIDPNRGDYIAKRCDMLSNDQLLLLKIVLNNCVFSFQGKFYKQLHGAAMGSPCSAVVANIHMEYFEKRALGPELPISFTVDTWLRYVDDVLTIVKKVTDDSLLNHLNSIDPNIKFTIEPPNHHGAILFLDTFPRPSGNEIITSVYRKPTHMDRYLDFNSNHPKSAKCAVVRALSDRAKNVCSSSE